MENSASYQDPIDFPFLKALQQKAMTKQLIELNNEDCINAYNVPSQSEYRNLVAISDSARSENSILWIDFATPATLGNWICKHNVTTIRYSTPCSMEYILANPSEWSLGWYAVNASKTTSYAGSHMVSRCLAERIDRPCSLKYDERLLIVVVVANAVKVAAMIATLLQSRRPALVTIGDGLASFLERPDATTVGLCIPTAGDDVWSDFWEPKLRMYAQDSKGMKRSSGASLVQWTVTFGL